MKGFQFNPAEGEICPICGSNEVKDAVFIASEPEKKEETIQLVQVHFDCLTEGLKLFPGPTGSVIGKAAPFYTKEAVDYVEVDSNE